MILTLIRNKVDTVSFTDKDEEPCRLGKLMLGDYYLCDTLENSGKLIPIGLYSINMCKSPKFERVLPLLYNSDVQESRGIRIHAGNTVKHTKGCILVGELDPTNHGLKDSRIWENFLVRILTKSLANYIIIVDDFYR